MSEPDNCSSCRFWHADPDRSAGECRRYPPVAGPRDQSDSLRARDARWARTADRDWCGEWASAQNQFESEPDLDPEQELWLRNTSAAQALLVLPEEQREELLCAILTEEERECPSPPDDFHERVTRYFTAVRLLREESAAPPGEE